MTGEEKIKALKNELDTYESGVSDNILCPYCGGKNAMGEKMCCAKLVGALSAILMAEEQKERINMVEEIANRA